MSRTERARPASRVTSESGTRIGRKRRAARTTRLGIASLAAVVGIVASAAIGVLTAAPANAHDYLVDSSPKAGSVQTTPIHSVRLTFDDVVLSLSKTGPSALLQVTGPNGASTHFETGCPTVSDRNVTAPVDLGGPGTYRATWQIVSADGHVVSDSIEFTYKPPAGTKESAGSTASACKGAAATAAPAATAGTAQGTVNSGALVIVVVIVAAIVVLALIAVLVIVLTRRRGKSE
ncbi:copper resistance protein CopC [Humibacter ginsenosidimutans]|uniref:Copper resistance protein CopC n=1 Tax=Humibacter ginsenosidimutans TaxID=2599293 RepID=A0A5B8M5F7_9MICO|nr:copper resistance protein CopC [Humibacter ginsenosidimutans]